MLLADKIMDERRKLGWSQEQLADRLGVTRQSVSKWESGSSVPELNKIVQLSQLYGVSVDYLVKDELESDFLKENVKNEGNKEPDFDGRCLEEKLDRINKYITGYSYTSKCRIWGIPLISIRIPKHLGKGAVAKGIIAIGSFSVGIVSIGGLSCGMISIGGLSLGALAIGGVTFGLLSLGGVAVGLISLGFVSIGIYALGMTAVGSELAVGMAAIGKNAIGEAVEGKNILKTYPGITGETIRGFLKEHCSGLWKPILDLVESIGKNLNIR